MSGGAGPAAEGDVLYLLKLIWSWKSFSVSADDPVAQGAILYLMELILELEVLFCI